MAGRIKNSVTYSHSRGTGGQSHQGQDYSVRTGVKTITPKKKDQHSIKFHQGGLHAAMGIKQGKKMTAAQHRRARSGAEGARAKKDEIFYENVLSKRRR